MKMIFEESDIKRGLKVQRDSDVIVVVGTNFYDGKGGVFQLLNTRSWFVSTEEDSWKTKEELTKILNDNFYRLVN